MDDGLLEDYFGDIAVPDSEEEDDLANDETFGVDTDDIRAGGPDSDAVWKSGHEDLAAQIEREKAAYSGGGQATREESPSPPAPNGFLKATENSSAPLQPSQYGSPVFNQTDTAARPPSLAQLRNMYMQHAQIYQHQYTLLQQQQRVIAEQQRSVMLQHQQFLRQNPSSARQVQEQQQQMMLHHQQQLAPLQHQLQSRQLAMAQIDSAIKAQAGPNGIPHNLPSQNSHRTPAQEPPNLPPTRYPDGRMEEIEREMAAAGLGPAGAAVRRENAARNPLPPSALTVSEIEAKLFAQAQNSAPHHIGGSHRANSRHGNGVRQASRKRLESMTDRDMELVLRMHFRQLEMAVPYKDEYYCFALKEKESTGEADSYVRLAEVIAGMEGVSVRGSSKRSGPKGARRSESGLTDDAARSAGKIHTPENLSTLATALGTLQVWNPKAPRKLVDYGRASPNVNADNKSVGDTQAVGSLLQMKGGFGGKLSTKAPEKLLREDDRIVVRAAVEEGYDILAAMHDIARRKAVAPIDPLMKSLYSVMRLQSRTGSSDAFLVRMCGFPKGKQFVARAFAVLKPHHKQNIACCVMRNLHLLVRSDISGTEDASHSDGFWLTLTAYAREGAGEPSDAVDMLRQFDDFHRENPATVVIALRSASGALLVYSAMQRVFSAVSYKLFEADTSADVSAVMGSLCDSVERSLGNIFEQTTRSAGTWQVAAMLDALAPPNHQARLRSTLKRLSDNGTAPPPPQA